MKKRFTCLMLLCAVLFATACFADTTPPDLLPGWSPAYTSIGKGKVVSVQESEPNKWVAVVEETDIFLGEKTPSKVELRFFRGQAAVVATPEPDWVGKTVLFMALKQDSLYSIPNETSPLSPNGSPFYVWQKDSAAELEAIRKVSAFFYLDTPELRARLIEIVTDDSIPLFLKQLALGRISILGENDKTFRSRNVQQFLAWRDLQKLPIGFRLSADFYALLNSPRAYQSDAVRLEFLKSVTTSKEASTREKLRAQQSLEEAGKTPE